MPYISHKFVYAYGHVLSLVILTGSPDCSILATDTETGSPVARLEGSHE